MNADLPPLPQQPPDTPWPTRRWPGSEPGEDVDRERLAAALAVLFGAPEPVGETHALLVVHRGELVAERYGPEHDEASTLISWSTAKSMTHALVGTLVRDGKLDVAAPAPVPAWRSADDPRREITTDHLLRMCDGLDFTEDYVDERVSHVIQMLFQEGKDDVAGFAEARPLAHPPGTVWNYSSGTTNVVSAIVGRTVGGGAEDMQAFMQRELFDRIGMTSARPRFDASGTFIGSSFVFATARDFARFGLLYLRDGVWEGERLLPEGWVDYARTPSAVSRGEYGAHWWLALDGSGIFHASGYRGQYVAIDPVRDLVVVRLGSSTPTQRGNVLRALADVVRSFPGSHASQARTRD